MAEPAEFYANNEPFADRSNGNGYWYFLGNPESNVADHLADVAGYGLFLEAPALLSNAQKYGSVLLEGAPGSGKTNIFREIQEASVAYDVSCFGLTMHVNSGKSSGIENVRSHLEAFRQHVAATGGIVLFDNADYVGYKGHSRRQNAAKRYAAEASGYLGEIIADPNLLVIGSAHDARWRMGHWTWGDPAIDQSAHQFIDSFASRLPFRGQVALVGLVEVMERRGVERAKAARVIRGLRLLQMADFFHANHVQPDRFLTDPVSAVAEIEAGRALRTQGHQV